MTILKMQNLEADNSETKKMKTCYSGKDKQKHLKVEKGKSEKIKSEKEELQEKDTYKKDKSGKL